MQAWSENVESGVCKEKSDLRFFLQIPEYLIMAFIHGILNKLGKLETVLESADVVILLKVFQSTIQL